MKKDEVNVKNLVNALEAIREALLKEGEAQFTELKPRTQRELFAKIDDILPFDWDGDSDAEYRVIHDWDIGFRLTFSAHSNEYSPFGSRISGFWVEYYGDDITITQDDDNLTQVTAALTVFGSGVNIVNLTPHDVNVYDDDGNVIATYPATGQTVRVETKTETVGEIDGVPVVTQTYGEITGLPDRKPNTVYLVSLVVRMATDRGDLLSPDTSPQGAVRNEHGQIIGTRGFVK
ncbi:hypothetical protein FDG96_gp10 [Bacillus phage Mgbh1]|uniref:Uncharacterized protein n=1 Tax=Bacillus phage Mgbh1 TaxID=1796993 RepID=A0A142F1L2_9CAUD|nr:hypothetical protein FDG96_gp10 [Bacillus phage Mgbh1]AMQ66669.1 hypothetical protein [Bacillus phage Mgbh1]